MTSLDRTYLENSDLFLFGVHSPDKCAGERCTIHNRSDHPMRGWRQHWRGDRGIMERICPTHGVGHPDPDSPWPPDSSNWIHGCCGCCAMPVGVNESDHCECPRCGADLRGRAIPHELLPYYGGRELCGHCGGPSHFSRLVGIYDTERDCTVRYVCPDCNNTGVRLERNDAQKDNSDG